MNMKNIYYSLIGLTLLLASCNTIEDRDALGPVLKTSDLKFKVFQKTAGANKIFFESTTAGVLPYWDWGTGFSNRAIDSVSIPFPGTYKMKYTAFCAGGTVSDSVTFSIAKMDIAFFDINPLWKKLTGGGIDKEKTWVWALDVPGGKFAGNGPEDSAFPQWWTMGIADYAQSTVDDEITFDLKGAANFTRKHTKDGSTTKGFYGLLDNVAYNGVTYNAFEVVGGPTMPWPNTGKYHVTVINDNELVVHEYKAYNVAMYKHKGFSY
jgi:hypothetical protein